MIGIKKFLPAAVFFNVCIATLCAACNLPIGSLQTDPEISVVFNSIKAESKRDGPYRVNDKFMPADDVKLTGYLGGMEVSINMKDYLQNDQVTVKIKDEAIDKVNGKVLTAGPKRITVSFGALYDYFDIDVEAAETDGVGAGVDWFWP
jgi:hypothetical protein